MWKPELIKTFLLTNSCLKISYSCVRERQRQEVTENNLIFLMFFDILRTASISHNCSWTEFYAEARTIKHKNLQTCRQVVQLPSCENQSQNFSIGSSFRSPIAYISRQPFHQKCFFSNQELRWLALVQTEVKKAASYVVSIKHIYAICYR